MFKKKKANIYMDNLGIIYIVKDKTNNIKGKIKFNELEKESYSEAIKVLRNESKQLLKKSKVREFNFILTKDIRMVKVIILPKEIKLNSDIDLILKEEILKYMKPLENINDYNIYYLKTEKTKQQVFLTAVINKKILMELCTYAIQDNIILDKIIIPEISMYHLLKNKQGINAIALYDEESMDLRILVCNNSDFIYANQVSNVYKMDIPTEINNLIEYVKSEYKENIPICYLIGADDLDLAKFENIKHIEENKEIDSKYMLLYNL